MTAQSDPYVRVYYRIIDDPKFANVYDDKSTLGWWLTLLLAADATYPAPANLPRRLPKRCLETLVTARLIVLEGDDRYRVHGLIAEREKRSEQGRKAAQARYGSTAPAVREQSASSAPASGHAMHSEPLRTEPLRTEPIQTAPLRTLPPTAVGKKNGSKEPDDEKRIAEYRAALANPEGHPAWYLDAAKTAVEVWEAQHRAN